MAADQSSVGDGMPAPAEYLISEDEERSLHRRLVDRDVTAFNDLARLFLNHLIAWLDRNKSLHRSRRILHRGGGGRPNCTCEIAGLVRSCPRQAAGPLPMHVCPRRSAEQACREGRHSENKIRLEDVELSPEGGKYLVVNHDPLGSLVRQEDGDEATRTVVGPVRVGLSEAELRALDLMLHGERKTAAFAEALGITHLPKNDQRTVVKRVKDKLKKRFKRETSGDGKPS